MNVGEGPSKPMLATSEFVVEDWMKYSSLDISPLWVSNEQGTGRRYMLMNVLVGGDDCVDNNEEEVVEEDNDGGTSNNELLSSSK